MTESRVFKSFFELGLYWHETYGMPLAHVANLSRRAVKSLSDKHELSRDMSSNRNPGYHYKHEL